MGGTMTEPAEDLITQPVLLDPVVIREFKKRS